MKTEISKKQQVKQLFTFIKLLNDFKSIERLSLIQKDGRRESDAEHTWHLTMAVWLLSTVYDKKIDLLKCIKIALVHDLVEIYAGDVYAYDPKNKLEDKEKKEFDAMQKLCSQLPVEVGNDFKILWSEYEERKTEEGKYVWALDKVMPRLQYKLTQGDLSDALTTDPVRKNFQEKKLEDINPMFENLLEIIQKDMS